MTPPPHSGVRALALLMLISGATSLLPGQDNLAQSPFSPAPQALREPAFIRARNILRSAPIRFQRELLLTPTTLTSMRISLLPGVDLPIRWQRTERATGDAGTSVWFGSVEGTEFGEATMVVTGNMVAANFNRHDGRLYQIRTTDDGAMWAMELDANAFGEDEPAGKFVGLSEPVGAAAADSSQQQNQAQGTRSADDGSQIDVMVVFTAAVRQKAGGPQAVQQLIQLAEAEANQGYRNSGIALRLSVVYNTEVAYTEAGIDTDLDRLTATSDGYLDQVHQQRDAWGADLVSLWTDYKGTTCGLAHMLRNPARPDLGFSVVSYDCATGYYSFGHEIGHNMGAMHARGDTAGTGYFNYSWGYKVANSFRSVMAYDAGCNCNRVNYWSNPGISYQGQPTGTATTSSTPAYNALTLTNTKAIVANYRQSRAGGGGGGAGGGTGGGTGGNALPESDHPYADNLDKTWTYTQSGNPASINVTFDSRTAFEAGYDYLYITDASGRAVTGSPFTGTTLAGKTVVVTGSTVNLRLTSDGDIGQWGFKVTTVTPNSGGSAGSLPRLEVTAFTAPAAVVVGVRNVTVRTSLANTGSANASRFRVSFYLSRDNTVTPEDVFTGYFCTFENGLNANSTSSCNGDIEIPSTVTPGTWYMGAIADDQLVVQQTDRGRNSRVSDSGATTVLGSAAADITQPAANSTLSSSSVTFAWTAGLNATGYTLAIGTRVGATDIFTRDAGTARQLAVTNLPTDGSILYVRLTTRFATGTASQSTDYTYRASTISATNVPKLVITAFTAPAEGAVGVNLTGTRVTLTNSGNADAPGFRVAYYYGRTANVTTQDVYSGWTCGFPEGLVKGASITCSGDVGVPSSLAPGTWYLAAIADDQNRIAGIDRSQAVRVSDSGPITIGGLSGAELTTPTAGSTISAQPVTFRWTAGSPGAEQYYIQIGAQAGGNEYYDGDQGVSRQASISGLPNDGRVVWLRLLTRYGDTWYTNDYSFRMADTRAALAARLVVSTFIAPTSGVAGGKLANTRMTVVNQGSGNAGPFRVAYYFGSTQNVTTADTATGWYCNVDQGLAPGAQFTCSGDIGVPATLPAGRYFLAAIADDQGRVAGQQGGAASTRVSENGPITITGGGSAGGNSLPESAHPYGANEDRTWTYTLPGARALNVTFDARTATEEDYDFLFIYDGAGKLVSGPWTGTTLARRTISVPGNSVRIRLTSDDSLSDWGFKVTSITEGSGNARLVVTSFTAPTGGIVGQRLSGARAVIQNIGTAAAGKFRLAYYLGPTPQVTTADVFTGWYCTFNDGLAAGQSTSCGGEIGIPSWLTPGRWYVAAIADDQSEISQADRSGAARSNDNGPTSLVDSSSDSAPARPAMNGEGFNQQEESRDEAPERPNRPAKR